MSFTDVLVEIFRRWKLVLEIRLVERTPNEQQTADEFTSNAPLLTAREQSWLDKSTDLSDLERRIERDAQRDMRDA